MYKTVGFGSGSGSSGAINAIVMFPLVAFVLM